MASARDFLLRRLRYLICDPQAVACGMITSSIVPRSAAME